MNKLQERIDQVRNGIEVKEETNIFGRPVKGKVKKESRLQKLANLVRNNVEIIIPDKENKKEEPFSE